MRKKVTSGSGRFESRPRSLKIRLSILLMTVAAVVLPDAFLPDQPHASGQVPPGLRRRPAFRGRVPEQEVVDGTNEVPFELLYSRSGSIYRNFRYAIQSNNTDRGLMLAQAILNAEEDHFVSGETGPAYSLKKLAFDYIESLPRETLKEYQQRWSLDAGVQLEVAKKSGDPAEYLKLLDSYYFTESGFEAVDWLATRALDLGRFRSASRLWNDAIDSPVHARHVTPMLLIKAAVANRLAGNGERAAELMQRLTTTDAGRKLHAKLDAYLKSQSREDNTEDDGDPFTFQKPWQFSLVESLNDEERNLLDSWRQIQWGEDRAPLCISREAVSAGDLLAVRSYNRVLFLDPRTGKLQSEYPVKPNLLDVSEEYEQGRLAGRTWERFGRSDFLETFVWNTLHSQLTSDGRHVYLIEKDDSWTDQKPLRPGERILARPGDRFRREENDPIPMNRIVALPVEEVKGQAPRTLDPVWTVSPADDQPQGTSGAYFLAAPVNLDGALYTLAEQDDAIKLMCLDPVTGSLMWSQGVMFPFTNLFEDADRRWRGCVIKDGGDLLVVTTQASTVVGLNPVRRTLEWIYFIGESSSNRRFGISGRFGHESYNYLGFLDEPLIADGRVVLLPRQSGSLHCLNLDTGQPEWKVPRYKAVNSSDRSDGDEYLGGVHEHVLIVAGTRNTRGLSMNDGRELWSISHPQISGRGVMQHGQFLIPVFDGSLRRIDVATGRIQKLDLGETSAQVSGYLDPSGIEGDHLLEEQQAPLPQFGHLMISGTQLISLGIEDVRSLDEPFARFQFLTALAAQRKLTGEEKLEMVMLDPSWKHWDRMASLEEMLTDAELPLELRRRIIDEYQNELFLLLEEHPEEVATISNKLEDLLKTDEDRILLTILRSQQEMQENDSDGALSSVSQLLQFDSDRLWAVPGDEGLSVSVGAWVRILWDWAEQRAPAGTLARFETLLQHEIQRVLERGDPRAMDRLLHQFPRLPQLDEVRLRLARARTDEARYHEAEMLLLTLVGRQDHSVRQAEAMVELADLWARFELFGRAADLLLQTEFRSREADLSDTSTEKLKALREHPGMQMAFSNFKLPSTHLQKVIVESHIPGLRQRLISDAYDRYFRIFPTSRECEFDLLAKRHDTDTTQHVLTIVSRRKGSVVAEIPIPSRGNGLPSSEDSVVGHYFPFASEGQIRGISLIDTAGGRPNWVRSFLDPDMNDLLYVGQFDSEQTCIRTHESLVMVSSRDGRVIWRRDHLQQQGSLNGNPRLSLFGDERVIARRVGESEFEIYNAGTGQVIPLAHRLPSTGLMGSVGRFLVAISYADGGLQRPESLGAGPSVAIIDVETGNSVYSSGYWTRNCCNLIDGKLILIDRKRNLRVIDVAQQEEILSIPVSQAETDSVTRLRYFSDSEHHYVNICRSDDLQLRNAGRNQAFANPASNPFLPTVDVLGQLIAVDKQSGSRRWDRLLQSCSVVLSPHASMPFLTTLSWRVEQRPGNTRRLHLEILSPETGETLGYTDDFVPLDQHQQIYHARYDRAAGLLELNGPMYRATVRFNTPAERALPDAGPF